MSTHFSHIVCVACLLSTGCRTTAPPLELAPRPVERQDQAASTHVSVISVARWEEFAEALQPRFPMKPEDALAQAVPSTMRIEEKLLDAFAARLKVAPPTSSSTSSAVSTETAGQTASSATGADPVSSTTSQSSTSRSETATTAPGNTSPLTFTPPVVPELSSFGATGALQGAIGMDAMARYSAATALFQEVQLLNRYVREATIRRNAMPYVVRLQVSVLPVLRGQAYDASTTISFFSGGGIPASSNLVAANPLAPATIATIRGKADPKVLEQIARERLGKDPVVPQTATKDANAAAEFVIGAADVVQRVVMGRGCSPQVPPTIVPLLVTDNLESAAHTRALAQVREYALALGVLTGGFAAGADLERIQRSMSGLVGQDLNSLLTVGRVSDNTLRIRLGAMLQAESRYAMVPRTHNVTLLVFVPKGAIEPLECARVRMIARTEITDAVRGKVLPSRTREQVTQLVHDVAGRYALPGDADGYERLRLYAQQNDYLNFENELVAMYKVEANDPGQRRRALQYAEALWLELTGILVGSQYSPSFFELPAPRRVEFAKGGAALVVDDTKTQTVATVPGGNDLVASELSATLYVKEAAGSEFPVAATRAEVFENKQVAQFVFRSIAPLIADPKTATFRLEIARVAPPWEGTGPSVIANPTVQYVAVKPPQPELPYSVTTGARVIRSTKGVGTLQVTFRRKSEHTGKVLLVVGGADLSSASNVSPANSLQLTAADWVISADGTAQLQLNNLAPDTEVSIGVVDDKGVGPTPVRVRVNDVVTPPPPQ